MEIQKLQEGSNLTIQLAGNLDSTTASTLEPIINELEGVTNLTIDFQGINYISSKGIREMISFKKAMQDKGTFKIINTNNSVREVFRLSGLLTSLNIQ